MAQLARQSVDHPTFDGSERPEDLSELSVLKLPPHIRPRYRRIILVSHARHCERLDNEGDALIVTSDWLLWRQAAERGQHCIHLEWALRDGLEAGNDETSMYLAYNDWAKVDGRDVTLFGGISLATLFWREVTLACVAAERVCSALDRLCDQFAPQEIVFYDLRTDYDLLDIDVRRTLVADIASARGIAFIDRTDAPPLGDLAFPEGLIYGVRPRIGLGQRFLRTAYGIAAQAISTLGWWISGRKPCVYMINNPALVMPLIEEAPRHRTALALLAEQWPKTPAFLWTCWRHGVRLMRLPTTVLSRSERRAIGVMVDMLSRRWSNPRPGLEKARWTFIRRRLIDSRWLYDRARRVKGYLKLLGRLKPQRVVIGDVTNGECRTSVEAAHILGIRCDELPNGMFLSPQWNDARIRVDGRLPRLERILVWGPVLARWARATAPEVACLQTGYPPVASLRKIQSPPPPGRGRWLVLPCHVDGDDVRGLKSNTLTYLIDIVQTLTRAGYREIRVKLHPGALLRPEYLARVFQHFSIQAEIRHNGRLAEHVEWADFVAGPVTSGAMLETPALRRPYYAFRPWPSSVDRSALTGIPLLGSAADLRRALDTDYAPNVEDVLQALCDIQSFPNPAERIWRALEMTAG